MNIAASVLSITYQATIMYITNVTITIVSRVNYTLLTLDSIILFLSFELSQS